MQIVVTIAALMAATLTCVPASADGSWDSRDPISVFGPVQLGPPGVFGGPDEPDTRFGQQLLILNHGEFVIQAVETGAFYGVSNEIGPAKSAWRYSKNKNYAAVSCANYNCFTLVGPEESANNFFVFDLKGVNGPIFDAMLSIGNGPNGVQRGLHDYLLFDVSTPIDQLLADYPVRSGSNPIAIYNDLKTGLSFGQARFGSAQNGSQILIPLNSSAFMSIEAAQGQLWAIGGTAVPEPASWGMMIAGFALLGVVMRRRAHLVAQRLAGGGQCGA